MKKGGLMSVKYARKDLKQILPFAYIQGCIMIENILPAHFVLNISNIQAA